MTVNKFKFASGKCSTFFSRCQLDTVQIVRFNGFSVDKRKRKEKNIIAVNYTEESTNKNWITVFDEDRVAISTT